MGIRIAITPLTYVVGTVPYEAERQVPVTKDEGQKSEVLFPVFQIRIQSNPDPDPAKYLNPEPEDLDSGYGSKQFLNTF